MMNKIARLTLASSLCVAAASAAYAATAPISPASEALAVASERDSLQSKRAELPREWRWERRVHSFDGMIRSR